MVARRDHDPGAAPDKRLFGGVHFAGMIAQAVIRLPYARSRLGTATTSDPLDAAVLASLGVAGAVLPFLHSTTSVLDDANYRWSARTSRLAGGVGCVLWAGALWLFWRSHRDLGRNWSPTLELAPEQTLVTDGVYARIRHPMYAAYAVGELAQLLLVQNRLAGPAGLLSVIPLIAVRVPREEKMMRAAFGAAYQEYAARTGAVIPVLRGRHKD